MKYLIILMMAILFFSCGKKSSSDNAQTVTSTPAIEAEVDQENEDSNNHFSATANKSQYEMDELILVEVKNLSTNTMSHFGFNFTSDTEELLVSRISCFEALNYGDKCNFVVRFKNPNAGYHKVKVTFEGMQLQLTLRLKDGNPPPQIDFLHDNHHTYADCYQSFKYQKNGFVKTIAGKSFCNFRGPHWDTEEKVEITSDPLYAMKDPNIDADSVYCPADWTVNSFEFAETVVEEHTNFWGGRKDVTILPGESKEICKKRNLFGCKEKKVFYSRLAKVNCY